MDFCVGLRRIIERRKINKLGLVLFKTTTNEKQQKSDSTNNLVNYLAGRLM